MELSILKGLLPAVLILALTACGKPDPKVDPDLNVEVAIAETSWDGANTCSGVYPSYWQDPAPKFADQWAHQKISNQPASDWQGTVFQISDNYQLAATAMDGDKASHRWQDPKFDAMFEEDTPQADRTNLANEYAWALMNYIQEGNIDTTGSGDTNLDWDICENKVRPWVHIPYQTYSVLKGREFTHGLTREAPVGFTMKDPKTGGDTKLSGAIWAVGFFNPASASVFADVWQNNGEPIIPTENVSFPEGSVIGKLLFSTITPEYMPMTRNLPQWQAATSTSPKDYCECKGCTMAEQSETCPRSLDNNPVSLFQFDVAVKDSRAPGTEWVFATFVADGQSKASEPIAWNRISPLGVMWGNDPMPDGQLASGYPEDPRTNGFKENIIFWDTVDMLNASGGTNPTQLPGHLGCNSRLNGPADKAYSTCMSCHMTASVPDQDNNVPPLAAQFGGVTNECALEVDGKWVDAGGGVADIKNGISYEEMDSVYFRNIDSSAPFNPKTYLNHNIYPNKPNYVDGPKEWISLDYSLQLSISLVQWNQWQAHADKHESGDKMALKERVHHATVPSR